MRYAEQDAIVLGYRAAFVMDIQSAEYPCELVDAAVQTRNGAAGREYAQPGELDMYIGMHRIGFQVWDAIRAATASRQGGGRS